MTVIMMSDNDDDDSDDANDADDDALRFINAENLGMYRLRRSNDRPVHDLQSYDREGRERRGERRRAKVTRIPIKEEEAEKVIVDCVHES